MRVFAVMEDIDKICKRISWASECKMDEETRAYFSERESSLENLYQRLKDKGIKQPGNVSISGVFADDKSKILGSFFNDIENVIALARLICALCFIVFFILALVSSKSSYKMVYIASGFGFLLIAIGPLLDSIKSLLSRKNSGEEKLDFNMLELKEKWISSENVSKLEEALKSWISWRMANDDTVIAASREQIEKRLNVIVRTDVDGLPDFCFLFSITIR